MPVGADAVSRAHRTPNPESSSHLAPTVYRRVPELASSMVDGLQDCGVAVISDTLGVVTGLQQMMRPAMTRRTTRRRVAGQAVTVAGALADNLTLHAALRVAGAGQVLVISAAGGAGAQWGDLVTHAAAARGVAAVVVDGACRDVDTIEELGFPVWATEVNPLTARKDVVGWVNAPVSCAGVYVCPGDVVVGDGDGVIVVPYDLADAVLASALARLERERDVRDQAKSGVLPGELSGLYDQLDAAGGVEVYDGVWRATDHEGGAGEQ
jgi:4-hydroxy-4-methyl-2-oxoglutarate aldolase